MAVTDTNRWKLGLFVVVGLGVMTAGLALLGAARFTRPVFRAVTYFDESVQGLEVGSPVKYRGVLIGTVEEISIAPNLRHVKVAADVYLDTLEQLGITRPAGEVPVEQDYVPIGVRAQLVASGITGGFFRGRNGIGLRHAIDSSR